MTSNYGRVLRRFQGEDSPWAGQFIFSIDGMEIGHFMEVSGLSVTIEDEKIPEGGQNEFVRRVPGRMTWPNLVLKRGITSSVSVTSSPSLCRAPPQQGQADGTG